MKKFGNYERLRRLAAITLACLAIGIRAMSQISPGELSRAHASLEGISNCNQCHEVGKKVTSAKCLTCHKEIKTLIDARRGYHVSSEVTGKECYSCHNEHHGRNFEIIHFDKQAFDHRKAGYDLVGKHKALDCKACHKPELIKVKTSQKSTGSYLDLGRECLACHADYHQKTLSDNCLDCHNSDAFKPATGFDHKKTKFQLIGKHASVECVKCHKVSETAGNKFQKFSGVAFKKCTDCHKDPHESKFGSDCRKCHNEVSFHEITAIKTFDHTKTDYQLEGRHQYIECKACHKKSLTTKLKFSNCTDCHTDYHKGQFRREGAEPDCKECHSLEGFKSSLYTIENHNKSTFQLTGAHLATPCISCHKKEMEWSFRDIGKRCIDCHENIHQNKISPKFLPDQNCEACHSVSKWREITFDHKGTSFPLTGKHETVSCRKCHIKEATGVTGQWFSGEAKKCLDCHADIHAGQFETPDRAYCSRCHSFENWKVPQFDHNNTRFKLDGKHKDVACAKCHKEIVSGTTRYTQYKFNSIKCADCHLQ